MTQLGQGLHEPHAGPWSSHARQWRLLGSPLRPVAADVGAVLAEVRAWQGEHGGRGPRVVLLGVTPELATMPWPPGTSLVAVDRSAPMIEAVFPKEGLPQHARAECADWRALPLDDGSVDLVVGDGCFSVFGFPGETRDFAREARRVLRADGRFVIRVFAAPDARESLGAIARDLGAGKIGSFHALKWRLAMALHPSPEAGVTLSHVHAACGDLRPLLADLASTPGFEPDVTATIEAYRGSSVAYTFPTVARLEEALAGTFALGARVPKSYELGERCPTLVLRPL